MSRRKLSRAEKDKGQIARTEQRMRAKALADVGGENSLFRDMAEDVTARDAYWAWRRKAATVFESCPVNAANVGMNRVQRCWIEHHAQQIVAGAFDRLRDHFERVYPHDYYYTFWEKVLTGGRVVFAAARIDDSTAKGGMRIIDTDFFELTLPPMTRAEFHERFPYKAPVHFGQGERPEDVTLFESAMQKLRDGCARAALALS